MFRANGNDLLLSFCNCSSKHNFHTLILEDKRLHFMCMSLPQVLVIVRNLHVLLTCNWRATAYKRYDNDDDALNSIEHWVYCWSSCRH